jgi:hypothetical protein
MSRAISCDRCAGGSKKPPVQSGAGPPLGSYFESPFFEVDFRLERFVEDVLLEAAAARFVPPFLAAVFLAPPRADERAAVFLADERLLDFAAVFLAPDFLAPVFLAAVFFAPVFRAAVFLAPDFLALDFRVVFAAVFRAAVFLAPDFFAAVFRAPDFRAPEPRELRFVEVELPLLVVVLSPEPDAFDLSSVGIAASFKGLRATPSRLIKATSL